MAVATTEIAVCGAHMRGLPLNLQLTSLGAEFVMETHTSADYRLYRLNGFMPERPGLVRVNKAGLAIALEVWKMPIENFGRFVAGIPSPLAMGTLTLADGSQVQGFLCEAYATYSALDISALGGWRGYLNSR